MRFLAPIGPLFWGSLGKTKFEGNRMRLWGFRGLGELKTTVVAKLEGDVGGTCNGGPPTEKWGGHLVLQRPPPVAEPPKANPSPATTPVGGASSSN